MRQILFYIHADSLFSFAPIEGVAAVGFVVPILMWVAYTLGFGWWQSRSPGGGGLRGPLISAAVGAAVLSCVPAVFGARLAPGIPVYGYGLMVFLGFITGGLWAARRARSVGIDPEVIWDLLTWFFVAGIGGARLFFLVQYSDKVYSPGMSLGGRVFATFNLSNGGLVLFGGVIAVVAAMLIFCRVRKVSLLLIGDVIVPSFFVGLAFGRIGCLLNGCCYGNACAYPWGIEFPQGSVTHTALVMRGFLDAAAPSTYPLHPTQIYSAVNAAMLAWLTSGVFKTRPRHGVVLALALIVYPFTRFMIEIIRGDEGGQFGTELTISQWVSLGLSASGLVLAAVLALRGRGPDGRPTDAVPAAG
ncbi:MAG: prolipoprotein diacylglyceryl transferase [Planctomycetota bacterium]